MEPDERDLLELRREKAAWIEKEVRELRRIQEDRSEALTRWSIRLVMAASIVGPYFVLLAHTPAWSPWLSLAVYVVVFVWASEILIPGLLAVFTAAAFLARALLAGLGRRLGLLRSPESIRESVEIAADLRFQERTKAPEEEAAAD